MSGIFRLVCVLLVVLAVGLVNIPSVIAQTPSFTESQLQQGDELSRKALAASKSGDLGTAEALWTQLIESFPTNPAVWSNRGNVRASQNKFTEAIADYNKSIELAPNFPDAYLNRGAAWEGLKQWQAAIADYNHVLEIDPKDAAAYNNRGNAEAGLEDWEKAIADYRLALDINPNYVFACANYALALYQVGEKAEATRLIRNLVRKHPNFPDMRAALTASLWEDKKYGEAESNWVAVVGLDPRYQDINWVQNIRRWPPVMVTALQKFLKIS